MPPPASQPEPRMSDPLKLRLKHLIVETLKLEDLTAEQIPDGEPLIGAGLNLDSIDALELVVRLEKEFGVKIATSEEARTALGSVDQLAAFIQSRSAAKTPPA
jgi:acyl carrier protein